MRRSCDTWRDVHQRMGKADFCAVDGAVAGALEDGERIVVPRVENNALGSSLQNSST